MNGEGKGKRGGGKAYGEEWWRERKNGETGVELKQDWGSRSGRIDGEEGEEG